jgi:hypothetical protein
MESLQPTELIQVVGGATRNDKLNEQMMLLQTKLKDLTCAGGRNNGNNNMLLMMAMAMMMRPQGPTVIAAGAPEGCAPSSVVNIHTRFRRR